MKKLLSFVIVTLMMVSLVVPAFAIPAAPEAPDPADNTLNVWMKDATLDVSAGTSIRMDVSVSNNTDGFTEMKIVAVYPKCLTMTNLTRGSAIQGTDFQKGDEKTEVDKVLSDFFTEIGLDAATELGPDGTWRSAGPVLDCKRTEEEWSDDEDDYVDVSVDFKGNGIVARYTFEYDESLNTDDLDVIPIKIYAAALHQNLNDQQPYCGQFVNIITGNGELTLTNRPQPTCLHDGDKENVNVTPATCTEPGSYDVKCLLCQEIIETGVVIPALGHDWGDWFVKTEPTPTEDGVSRRECSRCDAFEEEPIPYEVPHVHTYEVTAVVIPTATTAGKITYTCVDGDDTYDVDLPAYGAFAITVDDASVLGGEDVTVPVTLANTPYGVDTLRFLVAYDEGLTLNDIALANDVFATSDELIFDPASDAEVAAIADQAGITIDTAGKDFALVLIDTADLAVRTRDGAIANLAFTAPAAAGDYAVEIINIEDASVTLYDAEGEFLGFVDYTYADDDATITVHVHTYARTAFTAPTATADGKITYACTGCADTYDVDLPAYGEFAVTVDDKSVLGGEAIAIPVNVKNTVYGVDGLRFLVAYDEGLTLSGITLANDVFTADDELIYTAQDDAAIAAINDQYNLNIATAGKDFALVVIDAADANVRYGDGAILNLAFEAVDAEGTFGVDIINIEDASVTFYDTDDSFVGFIDYALADDSATVTVHVHDYEITAFVAPKAAEDGKLTYTCACGDTYDVTLDAYGTFGYEVVGPPIHAEAGDLYTVNLINTAYGVDAVRFLVYWDEALTVGVAPQPQIFTTPDELTAEEISAETAAALLDKAGVDFDVAGKKFAYVFGLADGLYTLAGEGELVLLTVTAPETAGNYEIGAVAIEEANVNYYVGDEFIGFIDYETTITPATVAVEAHDYVETIDPAATCTEKGLKTFVCSICGDTYTEEIPALGHDLVDHEGQEPTCTEIGWNAYQTCTRCDYTTYEEIAALGHDLVDHEAKEPTCTEIGWNAYQTCSRCDYTTYEEIAALGHDLVDHEAKEPTCTEIGWNAYQTCTRCDYTTYEEIAALGHDLVDHEAKEPTCTEIGWNAYQTCTRCDYTTYEEIPTIPHTPKDEWEVETEPTTTEDGLEVLRCSVCETILDQRAIAAKTIDLQLVPSTARLSDWSIDNNAKVINVTAKEQTAGKALAVFQLKLAGAPQNAFTMSDAAFAAGNKLQIKGVQYSDSQLERDGIRYFVSFDTNGYNQSYIAEITDTNGDVYYYTVNVTFTHDAAIGGVVPGYGANATETGISASNDHLINVVSKLGYTTVTYRLDLAKGATVRVISDEKPHLFQTLDGGSTFTEVTEINDNMFVYFKSLKTDACSEYDIRITYANGEYEDFHVAVIFAD